MGPISRLLTFISPAQLKRYGIYAILSFFISFCTVMVTDDMKVRQADVTYERTRNETLTKMLDEQYKLKVQQEELLKIQVNMKPVKSDTTHENH